MFWNRWKNPQGVVATANVHAVGQRAAGKSRDVVGGVHRPMVGMVSLNGMKTLSKNANPVMTRPGTCMATSRRTLSGRVRPRGMSMVVDGEGDVVHRVNNFPG